MPTLCLLEVTKLAQKRSTADECYFQKKIKKIKSEKHHISSSRSDVGSAISTKFCMVIEVVRAIILGAILFWLPSIVLALGGVENFVIYRNKAAKFSNIIETEDAHKTYKFCKNRARDTLLRGNYIGKIPFFQFLGP